MGERPHRVLAPDPRERLRDLTGALERDHLRGLALLRIPPAPPSDEHQLSALVAGFREREGGEAPPRYVFVEHEIERERQIIDAAIPLNAFSAVSHPSPYVAGSPALQELVERLLTQISERLRLTGSLEAQVTFGDVLQVTEGSDLDRLRTTIAVDLDANTVLLVLTPVCDLQRNGAPRILLLVGKTQPLGVTSWKYGDDARTAAIRLDDEVSWIKWNLKHIDTVSHEQLSKAVNGGVKVVHWAEQNQAT